MTTMADAPEKVEETVSIPPKAAPAKTKELILRQVKTGTYEIVYEGGGEAPDVLKGVWNKVVVANRAIEQYNRLKIAKAPEKRNGKGKDRV